LIVTSLLPLDDTLHAGDQWAAFGVVAALVILLLLLADRAKVFVGYDNRLSTSKTIALLWTPVVAYIVTVLAFIGSGMGFGVWKALVGSPNGVYLVLLGAPFAGAVGAKAIVSTRVADGSLQKPRADKPSLSDIFSDDNGYVDIVDSQYLLLNMIAIIIVLVQFVHRPGFGAPDIPWFLGALTGGSAGTYLANKAIQSNAPSLVGVSPQTARIGQVVQAAGANLNPAAGAGALPVITVGGNKVDSGTIKPSDTAVEFGVPPPPNGTAYPQNTPQQVVITTTGNLVVTSPQGITVVADAPMPNSTDPMRVRRGENIKITGFNLFSASDLAFDGKPLPAGDPKIVLNPTNPGQSPASCARPDPPSATDNDTQVTVTVPETTPPGAYIVSARGTSNPKVVLNVGPIVSHVEPPVVHPGESVTVTGQLLFPRNKIGADDNPTPEQDPGIQITLGAGTSNCPIVGDKPFSNDQVTVTVPSTTPAGSYIVSVNGAADPPEKPVVLQVMD
jgi:hypothetical protein